MSIDYRLTLDYQLQTGWLEPFINGLLQGYAVARRCSACAKTTFPPIRVCACQHTEGDWVNLSGKAEITYRCEGADGNFALVQFEGADTQTVVRLNAMTDVDDIGYLQCASDPQLTSNTSPASGMAVSMQPQNIPELVLAQNPAAVPHRLVDDNE